MFKHILVPVDAGDMSEATVKRACSFAREAGARISFYHAIPAYFPPLMAGEGVIIDYEANEAFRASMNAQAEKLLAEASAQAEAEQIPCSRLHSECDSPYEGIIAAAETHGCDLIFMSSHGRRGVRALLLGSETQKVLTHCKVPVLVYR